MAVSLRGNLLQVQVQRRGGAVDRHLQERAGGGHVIHAKRTGTGNVEVCQHDRNTLVLRNQTEDGRLENHREALSDGHDQDNVQIAHGLSRRTVNDCRGH